MLNSCFSIQCFTCQGLAVNVSGHSLSLKIDATSCRGFIMQHRHNIALVEIRVVIDWDCSSGPPCVSFSMMGKRLRTDAAQFQTHEALYENVSPGMDIQVVENVPEYSEDVVKSRLPAGFDMKSMKIDPRILGLPAARARIYYLAWRKSKLQWAKGFSLQEFMDSITSQVELGASHYWWMDLPRSKLTRSEDTWLQAQPKPSCSIARDTSLDGA